MDLEKSKKGLNELFLDFQTNLQKSLQLLLMQPWETDANALLQNEWAIGNFKLPEEES